MKRPRSLRTTLLFSAFGVMWSTLPAQANNNQALRDFSAANERLLANDARGAIELYESLLERGVEHHDVYYNLGNAFVREGRPVQAIVAYERALRRSPSSRSARKNLDIVRGSLRPDGAQPPTEAVDPIDTIGPLVAPFPPDLTAFVAVFANAALFALLLARRRFGRGRRTMTLGVVAAVGALLLSAAVVMGQSMVARDTRAVVVTQTPLRSGPDERLPVRGRLLGGDGVRIFESENDWFQVKSASGEVGWLPASSAARI